MVDVVSWESMSWELRCVVLMKRPVVCGEMEVGKEV